MKENSKNSLLKLTECAIMVALATVLSMIKFEMPMGGSITLCSMLPIVMIAVKYGNGAGIAVGLLYSLIQLLQGIAGGNVFVYCETAAVTALVVAFDYIVPFTVLGLSGAFRKLSVKNIPIGAYIGIGATIVVRFLCHFVTGVAIWGQWAPEGMSKVVYSTLYNGAYMLPELVITLVAAVILLQVPQIRRILKIKLPAGENKTQPAGE